MFQAVLYAKTNYHPPVLNSKNINTKFLSETSGLFCLVKFYFKTDL